MTLDLDAIEARAKAATGSAWFQCCDFGKGCNGRFVWLDEACERNVVVSRGGEREPFDKQDHANLAHIAGMDPQTVLAMVAEIRRLRGMVTPMGDQ